MPTDMAVIFDIDGVLVDSYQAHFQSWQRLATRYGRSMTESQFAATFGQTSREVIAAMWPGVEPDRIAALDAEKEALYRQIITEAFPVMPGAVELIADLHDAGFRLAVGSSGPPENVELVLDQLGPANRFQATVTGSDVDRGKPDPQVFLLAARRLHVLPAACAVVEDAAAGVAAARAAGMASIGLVSTGRRHTELAAADLVVDRLDQLSPPIVGRLITCNQETS